MNLGNIQKIARPYFQQFSCQNGWRALSSKPYLSKTKVESGKILALRREDINVWERRAPIAPQHIKSLKEQGINTLVQPSTRRAYTMQEYENAGAIITEDLSPASVIIGVKQVPIDLLIPDKSYAFFSHTIKAQEANMPLLDAMLAKNIRIIDYERMVEENGQRVAAFGKFAGVAGMYIGATHNYKNSRQAKLAIYELGEDIKAGKLPAHFGPLTFVFTGSGNVSQGAQEMFKELPHVYVGPHELKHAAQKYDHRTLVYTEVSRQDYLVPKLGGSFQASEFEAHPERYRSVFAEEIAPYANVIINGVYWAPKNPRLLTYEDALMLLEPKKELDKYSGCPDLPHTLLAICDISADLGGSIEFMNECTTIEYPFALHDIKKGTTQLGMAGDGVLICSIDNLPAQLPREATDYFGRLLLPWIPEMVNCDARRPLSMESGISNVVKNAIICSNGELTEDYKYIADLRARHENERKQAELGVQSSVSKKILVLGAGKVSSPFIEYHTRRQSTGVTVVSSLEDEVQHLANRHENTTPVVLDIERSHEGLDKLIQSHDVVVSLLPYVHHPTIASLCIKHKKNMVTASYVLPAMKELHERAKEAGITIVQEVGLDPGIDHLLAMDCIDSIKEEGGQVEIFISYCGGLPAPEHSENPLRYKFSWSPKGALRTLLNGARYLKNGQLMEIEPGMLLENVSPLDIFPGFHLDGYPNRDSTHYVQSYNIPEVKTMLRGTIRYHLLDSFRGLSPVGYAAVCRGLLSLGLFKEDPYPADMIGKTSSWKDLMNLQLGTSTLSEKELEIIVKDRVQNDEIAFQGVKGLGLLSEESVQIGQTPFDTLSTHLSRILEYNQGERDIVLLRHQIGELKSSGKRVQHDISLVAYGDPDGYTAMARTVSIPTAIAADMVLNGEILQTGNVTPLAKGIYKPMLKRLHAEDICWTHKTTEL
eukprot:gene2141-17728_t